MNKGRFIVFEGLDNTGKTSLITFFTKILNSLDLPVLTIREPGGTEFGEQIRSILKSDVERPELANLFLFEAARTTLIQQVIKPAVAEGKIVLCDRFTPSTMAYQGAGGVSQHDIYFLNNIATEALTVDGYIYLTVSREISKQRSNESDYFESKSDDFKNEVINYYDKWSISNNIVPIDSTLPDREVISMVAKQLDTYLHMQGILHNVVCELSDDDIAKCFSK